MLIFFMLTHNSQKLVRLQRKGSNKSILAASEEGVFVYFKLNQPLSTID